MKLPWDDAAVLILLDSPDGRAIVAEGSLRQMVTRIAARPSAEWHHFSLSLPDRGVAPFGFESNDFTKLILELSS